MPIYSSRPPMPRLACVRRDGGDIIYSAGVRKSTLAVMAVAAGLVALAAAFLSVIMLCVGFFAAFTLIPKTVETLWRSLAGWTEWRLTTAARVAERHRVWLLGRTEDLRLTAAEVAEVLVEPDTDGDARITYPTVRIALKDGDGVYVDGGADAEAIGRLAKDLSAALGVPVREIHPTRAERCRFERRPAGAVRSWSDRDNEMKQPAGSLVCLVISSAALALSVAECVRAGGPSPGPAIVGAAAAFILVASMRGIWVCLTALEIIADTPGRRVVVSRWLWSWLMAERVFPAESVEAVLVRVRGRNAAWRLASYECILKDRGGREWVVDRATDRDAIRALAKGLADALGMEPQ
jgi:hypothetical protein